MERIAMPREGIVLTDVSWKPLKFHTEYANHVINILQERRKFQYHHFYYNLSTRSKDFSESFDGNLEKSMAPHSSTLDWKILWTEEPGGLQSMESLRVGHN